MHFHLPFIALWLVAIIPASSHETPGHAEHEKSLRGNMGMELYTGRRGYWHAGIGVLVPLDDRTEVALGSHLVQEDSDAAQVPSFEAELIREFEGDLEMELFGFAYTKVERRQAWGVGLRATKRFAWQGLSVSPFFGPAYAQVRAERESTGQIETVHHTMLLGGLTLAKGPVAVTLLGSTSFYDLDPSGIATSVDLESLTHFAAFENNDGFVRQTAAVEIAWCVADWLTLHARYAFMRFDDETRHAIAFTPAVQLGQHLTLTGGFQLLRDGESENDLIFGALSLSF